MKMVLAIVNNDDKVILSQQLTEAGFYATKLATTGGFLRAGNTTFLIGVEDDQVQTVVDIIKTNSRRRSQMVPSTSLGGDVFSAMSVAVKVGGATIFTLSVDGFEKI